MKINSSLLLVLFVLGSVVVSAQRKLSPGEFIEVGGGQRVLIVECTGSGFDEECDVVFYDDSLSKGKRMKFSGRNIRAGEERVLKAKGRTQKQTPSAEPDASPADRTVPTRNGGGRKVEVELRAYWYKATVLEENGDMVKIKYDDYNEVAWVKKSRVRELGPSGEPVTAACSFAPPPGNFSNSSPASIALFKREVYDYYNRAVNGSKDWRRGVVFSSFESGAAYKNTVVNVPGQGATRKHEGAPVNATIYPVKASFVVCEEYQGQVTQKQVAADFSFYLDANGEWTCSKDS